MIVRFMPRWRRFRLSALAAVFALAAAGVTAAALQSQFQRDEQSAHATFVSTTSTMFVDVRSGTTVFEAQDREFSDTGTFVTVQRLTPNPFKPSRIEFGCLKVSDSGTVSLSGLTGAQINVTVPAGFGNCRGPIKGSAAADIVAAGGGPGGPPPIVFSGLLEPVNLQLVWNPVGAVRHSTFSSEFSCLDNASQFSDTTDSTSATAEGTINGTPAKSSSIGFGKGGGGGGFGPGASLSVSQGESASEGVFSPACFGF